LCQCPKTKTALVTEKDKYSYALGAHFGNQAQFQLVAAIPSIWIWTSLSRLLWNATSRIAPST
jgi:hypothetical protein